MVKKASLPQNSVDLKKAMCGFGPFVFCERSTGIVRFRAEANADPNSTVERIAGQLAMQCLVRGHDPDDFVVLVPAEGDVVGHFLSRAKELLDEGRAVYRITALSPRQNEILLSVIRNRANKEIALKLNITVRTVKFHVSSLLTKFCGDNRVELARRAVGFLQQDAADTEGLAFRPGADSAELRWLGPVAVEAGSLCVAGKRRSLQSSGRSMTA
jgi:DNA-binding CsgD family transcriptional regulator